MGREGVSVREGGDCVKKSMEDERREKDICICRGIQGGSFQCTIA